MTTSVLSGTGLRKSFGASTLALRGVDIEVAAGEIVAIMGPSGSGKSTLLHCLAGILVPDAGVVRYDGREISNISDSQRSRLRRDDFAFVFQFGQLVPELTAEENVALPALLRRTRRKEALRAARLWLDRFDLAGKAKFRPGELAGGEKQRVAVARAMMSDPRIVFADEPTGSLDSIAGNAVMDMLVDAARGRGATVVLVTHDARVAAHADRELVIRDGRTVIPQPVMRAPE